MTDRVFYQEMGRRVRVIRRALGLTQAALGKQIGVSAYTIFVIENVGRVNLTDERLTALAAALDVFAWQIAASDWREQCGV